MNDITKCQHKTCEKQQECLRYMAEPNPLYQSFGVPQSCPDDHADFMPIPVKPEERREK